MNDAFRHQGFWWLPTEPDQKTPGAVTYTPDEGLVLELQGVFRLQHAMAGTEASILIGLSNAGMPITLQYCATSRERTAPSGFDTSRIVAGVAFLGAHFPSPKDVHFRGLLARYTHLGAWSDRTGLDGTHREFVQSQLDWHERRTWFSEPASGDYSDNELSDFVDRYWLTLRYRRLKPVLARVGDFDIEIQWLPNAELSRAQATVEETPWLAITAQHDRPLGEFFPLLYDLRNFLTLAMNRPTEATALKGKAEASKVIDRNGKELYKPVDIVYPLSEESGASRPAQSREMLFSLADIEDDLTTYLRNWVSKASELRPVYDLYFSTRYNPRMYVRSAFLTLTQAVEAYHRIEFGGKYLSDDEYKADLYQRLVQAIPADVDPAFKSSLAEGTLQYANEYSLRKRLKQIADREADHLPISFITNKKRRQAFVDRVCDARNTLTHPDQHTQVDEQELRDLLDKVEVLLEVCLLKELGLDYQTIRSIIRKSRRHKEVCERP